MARLAQRRFFLARALRRIAGGLSILCGAYLTPNDAGADCQLARAELPVTMVGLAPTVNAKLNGAEVRLIVDSGAIFGVLTPSTMTQYKLKQRRLPSYVRLAGMGGTAAETKLARVDEFTLNKTAIPKVEFLVAGNEFGSGIAGVLGQNILHTADVDYDLQNGMVRLVRPTEDCRKRDLAYWAPATEPHSAIDLSSTPADSDRTVSTALINGKAISVMFDSGASVSILSLQAAQRLGITAKTHDLIPDRSSYGFGRRRVDLWIAPIDSFKIGDEKITNTRVRIGDLDPLDIDMLLGADFFLSHRIYVANSQQKIYFSYSGGPVFTMTTEPPNAPRGGQEPALPTTAEADGPITADGFSRRGMAFLARRDYERAIADLSRAFQLEPTSGAYLYQRAMAYADHGQGDLAAKDLDQALGLQPKLIEARMARAELRLTAGDFLAAREDLDEASSLCAPEADVRFLLGQGYLRAQMFEAAVAQLDLWISSHQQEIKFSAAIAERCSARALGGFGLEQALTDCEMAIAANADSAQLFDRRGTVQLRRGKYALATMDFESALKIHPKSAWALFGRGLARLRLGQTADGQTDLSTAEALRPGITAQFRSLGIAGPESQGAP